MQNDLFMKMKKNDQCNDINQSKKTIDCSRPQIRPVSQDVRIQCKSESSTKLNTPPIKDINSPIYQPSFGVIQMFNPDAPDTWRRPDFFPGIKDQLWDRQIQLYNHVVEYPDYITRESETTVMTLCPICRGLLDYQGATIDHITNWREYAQKIWHVRSQEDLKEAYNDTDNLILVHASCNASKGDSEISEFGALGHIPGRRATWGTAPGLEEIGERVKGIIRKLTDDYDDDMESRRNVQELKQLYTIYRITGNSSELEQKMNNLEMVME